MVRQVTARAWLVLTLPLTVLLAGCNGDGPPPVVRDLFAPQPAEEGHDDTTGAIVGRVVDEEYQPLNRALVGFVEPYIADETDETGYFEIGQLTPGKWDLYVIHLGHKADGLRVTVLAGQETEVTFVLPVLPVERPWYDVVGLDGRIAQGTAGMPIFNFGTSSGVLPELPDKPKALHAVIVALSWQNTQSVNTGLRMTLTVPESDAGNLLDLRARNGPLQGQLDKRTLETLWSKDTTSCNPDVRCVFSYRVEPNADMLGFGFDYDQDFRIDAAFFYRMDPPSGFTPLPDA